MDNVNFFLQAIDEPGFAKAYANMCKLVANMEVKLDDKTSDKKGNSVVFRKLLLTRCQNEFESNKAAELDSEKRLQEIKECTDPVSICLFCFTCKYIVEMF